METSSSRPKINIEPLPSPPQSPGHESVILGPPLRSASPRSICFKDEKSMRRISSPIPGGSREGLLLSVPTKYSSGSNCPTTPQMNRNSFEEDNELMRSCNRMAKALGIQKSFSTSDIENLIHSSVCTDTTPTWTRGLLLERSLSEMKLLDAIPVSNNFDASSRSLSTWVAVGDVTGTSQLPSPQASSGQIPSLTPADLIRSVNKTVRYSYLRHRLLETYKALERLSKSDFNLEKVEASLMAEQHTTHHAVKHQQGHGTASPSLLRSVRKNYPELQKLIQEKENVVSPKQVDRDRGKPLSKYERNMMIFDWLHTLDESASFDAGGGEGKN